MIDSISANEQAQRFIIKTVRIPRGSDQVLRGRLELLSGERKELSAVT